MTRRKKSRKPGPLAPRAKPREATDSPAQPGKQVRRRKGRKPGARHNVTNSAAERTERKQQDSRIGSKKPVPLPDPANSKPAEEQVAPGSEPVPEQQLWAEFRDLEHSEKLQELLALQEAGNRLTADQQAWLDQQLDRYAELAEQLGVDLAEEESDGASVSDWDAGNPLDEWRQQ